MCDVQVTGRDIVVLSQECLNNEQMVLDIISGRILFKECWSINKAIFLSEISHDIVIEKHPLDVLGIVGVLICDAEKGGKGQNLGIVHS